MSDRLIEPITAPFSATITPPGSKSLTNRALVMASLADGGSEISNILLADDTLVMLDGLRALGFALSVDEPSHCVQMTGSGGRIPAASAAIHCGNSGTTIRFLTAVCALGRGEYVLDGVERMRQRPIGALSNMLRNLGARIEHEASAPGLPPVRVLAAGLPGGVVRCGREASSQFLSALLMVAPYARREVTVLLDEPQTSWPYVAMTMQLMDRFGVTVELIRDPASGEPRQIIVPQSTYEAGEHVIEPDASSASYFLAAAAIHPGSRVTIADLGSQSLQGDVGFARVLERMGAAVTMRRDSITLVGPDHLDGIDIDLSDMPDTAQTLAVTALFASGPTTIRGLHTLRVKETDRLAALAAELTRLGAAVSVEGDDSLTIRPPTALRPAAIETYDDHRMAMSFAVAGTKQPGITIRNAECVGKTYPAFFDDLGKLMR